MTSHRFAHSALIVLLTSLSACIRGHVSTPELYRLRSTAAPSPVAGTAGTDGVDGTDGFTAPSIGAGEMVSIESYVTPGLYGDPQIVYREGNARYGTYPNREWAIPLGTMLATLTVETLRHQPGMLGRVHDDEAAAPRRGLRWRGTVREFEEVDRGDGVFASVWLEARLVRAADDSVLWSGSSKVESSVNRTTDMRVVVDSLSSLATAAINRMVRDAAPALRVPASR